MEIGIKTEITPKARKEERLVKEVERKMHDALARAATDKGLVYDPEATKFEWNWVEEWAVGCQLQEPHWDYQAVVELSE